jgi:hypothetical protein
MRSGRIFFSKASPSSVDDRANAPEGAAKIAANRKHRQTPGAIIRTLVESDRREDNR